MQHHLKFKYGLSLAFVLIENPRCRGSKDHIGTCVAPDTKIRVSHLSYMPPEPLNCLTCPFSLYRITDSRTVRFITSLLGDTEV